MSERIVKQMKIWLQAVRAFSFTASLVPVFLGAAMALCFSGEVAWGLFPLVVICSLLFQGGTNLVSDYFDFKGQVDKDYTFGSSRVIVDNLLRPRGVLVGGLVMFAVGSLLGLVFVVFRGWPILAIGIAGLAGGFFYTAKPVGYKYVALGDVMVFILMGPLMVVGSYFVLTGSFSGAVVLVSVPVGFLVTAILHANNLRDIRHDGEAGVKTVANLLGHAGAQFEYYFLVTGAYVIVAVLVAVGIISPWSLLVFLTVPIGIKNIRTAVRSRLQEPAAIASLDVDTAKLHLAFGVVLVLSILIGCLT